MKLCACGCGQEIKIKKHHKYYGIPNYIKGHTKTNTNRKAWTIFFQELLKERYSYEYTQDQKIILNYMEK